MPRVKTYSAASGFVYQYQFTTHTADTSGNHYCFETTQDRKSAFEIEVLVPSSALAGWEESAGRELTPTERYAVAKMALFAALDEAASPNEIPRPVEVRSAQAGDILDSLDI